MGNGQKNKVVKLLGTSTFGMMFAAGFYFGVGTRFCWKSAKPFLHKNDFFLRLLDACTCQPGWFQYQGGGFRPLWTRWWRQFKRLLNRRLVTAETTHVFCTFFACRTKHFEEAALQQIKAFVCYPNHAGILFGNTLTACNCCGQHICFCNDIGSHLQNYS